MSGGGEASAGSVRLWLRASTHRLHLDLHAHPLYRRLLEPGLTLPELRATAAVTYAAAGAVEAARAARGIWPELSLADYLRALGRDLGGGDSGAAPEPETAHLGGDAGLLGALYVIHGSAFGGAALEKSVSRAVPSAPGSFFVPRSPAAWRCLCRQLEALPAADLPLLAQGAKEVFRNYKRLADFHMRSSLPREGPGWCGPLAAEAPRGALAPWHAAGPAAQAERL